MGFEYSATTEPDVARSFFHGLHQMIDRSPEFQLLDGNKTNQLLFRWITHPENAQWPEDAMITLDENRIYVLIHNATKSEREGFFQKTNLVNSGVVFEEL